MLIASIPVRDINRACQDICQASSQADGIELRLDYLQTLDLQALAKLCQQTSLPIIITLRKKSQGGFYLKSESERLQDILDLCQLNPDFMDVEHDVPESFLQILRSQYPSIKLIGSYHDFEQTPSNLMHIFQSMQNAYYDVYKIATFANTTLDALRMMRFVQTVSQSHAITGICMGESGQCTRILSPIIGNTLHYASLDNQQATAAGQLTLQTLLTTYHFRKLNRDSKIYALLGDPIHLSVGHLLHNQAIELLQANAVYVKLHAAPMELEDIIQHCRYLPFAGFSITMPLKECIIPLLDQIEDDSKPIQAINSIINKRGQYTGFNTDGKGAIQALSEKMDIIHQTIVILGAGGAARAIAYEALQQKANVMILNRTVKKAKELAAELGCQGDDLKHLRHLKKMGYTAIINTIPNVSTWLQPDDLLPNIYAMDIVYQPIQTDFLQIAQTVNGTCIYGYEMYIYQALMQIKQWFSPTEHQFLAIKTLMQRYFSH